MKNLILPSLVVLGIIGFIVIFGGPSSKNPSSTPTQAPVSESSCFDENAKVMYFYSDLCSWCQKQKIVLDELAKDGYRVKPMDVKAHPDYFSQYSISGIPSFIAPDGERLIGYQEKEKLKEFLEKYK